MILKYFFKKQNVIFFLVSVVFFFVQTGLSIIEEPNTEKPIVVVTCMYNNEQWVLYNLNSIFMQEYSNFRLIIVDDGSQDKTPEIIGEYIETYNLSDHVTFIANTTRKRKLANLYHVLYLCDDDEIVVMLDGDDWLAHEKVFQKINQVYTDEDVWFTYGQYYNVPPEEAIKWGYSPKGYATEMPKDQQDTHDYRSGPFRFMHLRTFYGWLFKVVKLQDLLSETVIGFKGAPFPASNDLAMYYPMIETAHYRIRFVSEIVYIRNLFSEIVGFKVDRKIQRASAKEIRKKKHYPVRNAPIYRHIEKYLLRPVAGIMVCDKSVENSVENVEPVFDSITNSDVGIQQLYLVCHYGVDKALIDRLENRFGVQTFYFHYTDEKSLSVVLQQLFAQISYEHVMLMTSDYQKRPVLDCQMAAYWLEKSYARAFYTNLKPGSLPNQPWLVPLDDHIYAWKTGCARGVWRLANPVNGVIYRTKDLQSILGQYMAKTVAQLTLLLKKEISVDQSAVSLCCYS